MSDLAARLREAFLGTETGEAVPFDELKDAVKDRWQRVADAARVPAEVPPLSTIQRMSENQGYSTSPPAMPTPLPSTIEVLNFDQVEALARVLEAAYSSWLHMEPKSPAEPIGDAYLAEARAAIAHLDKPQPIKCIFCDFKGDSLAALKEHSAKCEAHPLAKRPEVSTKPVDLWAVITSIVDVRVDCDGCDYVEIDRTSVSDLEVALRPWLRDPVGWELDVTAAEMDEWRSRDSVGRPTHSSEILYLCRSRIKPVYECKECAKKDDEYQDLISATNDEADRINRAMDAINAARAALEGE